MRKKLLAAALAIAATTVTDAAAFPVHTVFFGTGGNNTSVTPTSANAGKNAFEAAIGGSDNGNSTAVLAAGFRTVTWDAITDAMASPNLLPADHFNSIVPRGVLLLTPGTGVAVSDSTASGTPYFSDINSTYLTNFMAFSPERVFAPVDSNIVQVYFFQPGTNIPAMVRGFGAVFKDVELPTTTSMRFFGFDGTDYGKYFVQVGSSGEAEFLGVLFGPEAPVGHVVITLGNAALAPGAFDSGSIDVVAMDDLVYAEPRRDDIFNDGF
jgi:hypothetical protein